MKPRKSFAQHWLRNQQALDNIVAAAALQPGDCLLEIGSGTGNLTRRLLPLVKAVVGVEIDRDLCKKLVQFFRSKDNFLLLQGDILNLDLDALLSPFPNFQNPRKVVANIPYNITGPILEQLLGTIAKPAATNYDLIVLLVQKEVADRLTAQPGTKAFGALSLRVGYLAECELICSVPAQAFYPPPKVDSAVVRLRPRPIPNPAKNPLLLERIIKLGFTSKRKMLRNNLKSLIDPIMLTELMKKLAINPQGRGEDLSLHDWIALSNLL
ncbi:MAG: 16S rRNA (adenine(1518)-N(6)/adenine(1519)-N(6))-dimethyltransferase RsmA [Prochloron sp. SP5CPC1]|nr:16S rRNA (adenine(1518)-N(6)/adenine(1519)-N(6))-dimethyltransferase RsmA [Candidatus Paraprochloron terpiosi SP5CPC1]